MSVQPGEVVIGKIINLDDKGTPLVDYPGNRNQQPLPALTTVSLSIDNIGREVALLFAEGDLNKPIIMGLIQSSLENMVEFPQSNTAPLKAQLDGDTVVLSAEKEIVLQCGKASITLTRAGKILIRGAYVLSRSSGVNRLKGASIQIN
ncbi:hypothetical protein PN36_21230 [Candidatus Thiomargarita nelsonii]|uniref:DUF6484 domain-containing protein n=1 Tax=Candidatus Thiomargarita nelsonii TaxID=1003181 RepID=A0A0A6PK93_9GAMM|nr:hypothetical protein PN36_21230 [Candidatus Thiomargarita nelsonii]